MKKLSDMTRQEKVALFVVGTLDDLKAGGLVDGGRFQCTKSGREKYELLKADGFSPTKQEINDCMSEVS